MTRQLLGVRLPIVAQDSFRLTQLPKLHRMNGSYSEGDEHLETEPEASATANLVQARQAVEFSKVSRERKRPSREARTSGCEPWFASGSLTLPAQFQDVHHNQ